MTKPIQLLFRRLYPGPFDYCPSRDGVDDTFEVGCLTSGEFVIAAHYWDAREWAETRIAVVTAVLNDALGGEDEDFLAALLPEVVASFRDQRPGPYFVQVDLCEQTGVLFSVTCRTSGKEVISTTSRLSNRRACVVGLHIAAALNAAFGHG